MRCVVCSAEKWHKKFNRLGSDFVACSECGLVRMETIPTSSQIRDHYRQKYVAGNYELLQRYEVPYQKIYAQLVEFTVVHTGNPGGRER